MATLPAKYQWLLKQAIPEELKFALSLYGNLETPGAADNPFILQMAEFVGVRGWYPHDSVPWCGLAKGYCAKKTGWLPQPKYDLLSALSWLAWGTIIPKDQAMCGDTLIFSRPGGGHVGWYIAEDKDFFLVYGGNTNDAFDFAWIAKNRLMGVRRAKWRVSQPAGVRKFYMTKGSDKVSTNES